MLYPNMPFTHDGSFPHWQCDNSQVLSVRRCQTQHNTKYGCPVAALTCQRLEVGIALLEHFFWRREAAPLLVAVSPKPSSFPVRTLCVIQFSGVSKTVLIRLNCRAVHFSLTHRTGLGGVAQRILKMMTLPHIASKPCMLKASEMSPAATVSNTCDVSSSTAGIKAVRLSMDKLVEGESWKKTILPTLNINW